MSNRASEDERLMLEIDAALKMLHPNEPSAPLMEDVSQSFPSPVFFMECSEHVKRKVGFNRLDALYFTMIPELARYVVEEHFGELPKLDKLSAMSEYLVELFRGIHRERFYALLLNARGRKISTVLISKGGDDAAEFDLKHLLYNVVAEEARYVVLCHNHPRGTPEPSEEDIQCTLRALKALNVMGVPLLDHLIVAGEQIISIRNHPAIPQALWTMQAPNNKTLREWNRGDNGEWGMGNGE